MPYAHLAEALNLAGLTAGALGGLFLAYDLLGGAHGPLRTLMLGFIYSLLFGLCYGLAINLPFALCGGPLMGGILAVELRRADVHRAHPHGPEFEGRTTWFGLASGVALGLASWGAFGAVFGLCFGLLSALGMMLAYAFHLSATQAFHEASSARSKANAVVARGVIFSGAGGASAWLAHSPSITPAAGFAFGLVGVVVSILVGTLGPAFERWSDHLPHRRLGLIGIGLALLGYLILASVPISTLMGKPFT